MAKPNYRHAKKQKEAARKARKDAKQQRRATAPGALDAPDALDGAGADGPMVGAGAGSGPESVAAPTAGGNSVESV